MHILLTGGAGFIGSHLADRLLADGHAVTTVDNFNTFYDPAVKRANVAAHLGHPAFRLAEGDIRDLPFLTGVFEQAAAGAPFDAVVHLAAMAGVRPSIEQPGLYQDVNVAGTQNIFELCRRFGVGRCLFGSSSSVYGVNNKVPFAEDDPVARPVSPYAATKAAGELLAHVYSHLYGIRMVCLRFFTVYGPRQRPDLAIHKFTRLIDAGRPIPVFGDGSTRRDYTYVDDIVRGVTAALHYDGSLYEIVNLGNSRAVPLHRLIAVIEDALGKKAVIDRLPDQPGDVPQTFADIDKAGRLLGYRPATAIEAGVAEFVRWYREGREEGQP